MWCFNIFERCHILHKPVSPSEWNRLVGTMCVASCLFGDPERFARVWRCGRLGRGTLDSNAEEHSSGAVGHVSTILCAQRFINTAVLFASVLS